jgi:GNAT superfamily N-acetyltransferase
MANLRIETLRGNALLPLLPALAQLRIAVFRAWPYLYEGDQAYEQRYMATYAASEKAAVIVAFDGQTPAGASTCLPLTDETANVQAPFLAHGIAPERVFYFGESVLLPQYRGGGTGVAFFAAREAHAKAASTADFTAFCAVQRAADDPRRPPDAVPLDAFWQKRGYTRYPSLTCEMRWREIGNTEESTNTLMFWLKSLSGAKLP